MQKKQKTDSDYKYRFDLHMHSFYSDGTEAPKDIVEHIAKNKLLEGFSLTDHDNFRGLAEARAAARKHGLICLPGVEITTELGDIIAVGIEEIPKWKSVEDLVDKIKAQGAVAIGAHPHYSRFKGMPRLLKKFDAVEIYNATTAFEYNAEAMELAKAEKLLGVAVSDSHVMEMAARAWTSAKHPDIITAIKKGEIRIGWL
jgi:hypothetical protein